MDAKEITVGYTYTKNLGNFENVKVDASVTITHESGQDLDELYDKAYDSVKNKSRTDSINLERVYFKCRNSK